MRREKRAQTNKRERTITFPASIGRMIKHAHWESENEGESSVTPEQGSTDAAIDEEAAAREGEERGKPRHADLVWRRFIACKLQIGTGACHVMVVDSVCAMWDLIAANPAPVALFPAPIALATGHMVAARNLESRGRTSRAGFRRRSHELFVVCNSPSPQLPSIGQAASPLMCVSVVLAKTVTALGTSDGRRPI